MKKIIPLSLIAFASLYATDIELAPIGVESTVITEVAQNASTSVDVADVLTKSLPSIDMSRRSGIANDILIRGQKRDNISVEIDGTKVCGACPNRMDPPISHVLADQIDEIEVTEGPYDVSNFGTLSGGVKIKTKQPTKEEHAQINLGYGSWNYKKLGATASGGNDFMRFLITGSLQSSDQYEDGNGDTLAQQMKNKAPAGNQLQAKYEDMEAYDKKSLNAKAFISTATNQELRLSYTANRSNTVLYANTPMDAMYDDSNIYSVDYNIKNLSDAFKNLNLQYYYSDVDHPMSTELRNAALVVADNKTNHMWTTMQGVKLKNDFDFSAYKLLVGVDASQRTWRGEYVNNVSGAVLGKSIDAALTKNVALFSTLERKYGKFNVKLGARLDSTKVSNDNATHQDNDYTALNANVFTTYALNNDNKLFVGVGQASRVPDGRELYFQQGAATVGTPDLKQTTNRELDIGYEADNNNFKFKIKAFYSKLSDYIYIQKGVATNAFTNIDATVYGAELSGNYYVSDDMTLDAGLSYKRGRKDNAIAGQNGDMDLADMAPLRANLAMNYEYANNSMATLETNISDKWNNFDADNGEQALAGWAILNTKVKHHFSKMIDFTVGINNMLDKTYVTSNTYADLTLLTTGGGEVMLLNEPGRYFYTNLDFKF